jgi:hypothetical protein
MAARAAIHASFLRGTNEGLIDTSGVLFDVALLRQLAWMAAVHAEHGYATTRP